MTQQPPDTDPRYGLANERTFLAWVRTSVAVIAGGVALEALEVGIGSTLRLVLAVALVAGGGALGAVAWLRWRQVDRAIAAGRPLPRMTSGPVIATLLVAVSALLVVGLLL